MLLLYALVAKGSHSNISHSWLTLKIATGTAEVGGWTTRELLSILDGLEGLSIIGGDVVEVAPIYDNSGETTVLAAAQVVHSLLTLMVQKPVG
jgi:agmatinase